MIPLYNYTRKTIGPYTIAYLVFAGLIISCVVVGVLAILYEGLKAGREALARAGNKLKPRRGW